MRLLHHLHRKSRLGTLSSIAWAACLSLGCMPAFTHAQQMAPSGYTGAINTPTADVIPMGSARLNFSNSNPEIANKFSSQPFGSLNVGFGVLPGLEIVGRLAFDGNLTCDLFFACPGGTRDLSVGAKYQLPLKLPLDTKLALGFTDFGGAATNFRSAYGVASNSFGPVDLSLGYGKAVSSTALLNGLFGSATLFATDHLKLISEYDSKAFRVGAAIVQPISDQLALEFGASRKLTGPASQASNQISASLHYFFEKQKPRNPYSAAKSLASIRSIPSLEQVRQNDLLTPALQASAMLESFKKNGFAQVSVSYAPSAAGLEAAWHLTLEPLLKRHDQAAAIGSALAIWLQHMGSAPAALSIELTYMGRAYRRINTTRQCVVDFALGNNVCTQGAALAFDQSSADAQQTLQTFSSAEHDLNFKPQLEMGLNLKTAIGTELALVDYSLALDAGAQMQLGKGLFWQGNVQIPALQSENFRENKAFTKLGHPKARVDQALLSYLLPVNIAGQQIQTQFSAGSVNAFSRGAQADALWLSNNGQWRVGGTLGAYNRDGVKTTPTLLSVRRSLVPGKWMLEGTAGEFLAGDRGWMLKSQHWFGNVGLNFFVHSSDGRTTANPKRSFAGFEISLPFGGLLQKDYGWLSVRGMDRFAWGSKTKIGDTDNAITAGFAEVPRARHGIWTDFSDYDRAGSSDIWANRDRIRDGMAKP